MPAPQTPSRRTVLAGLAGVTGTLAGCSRVESFTVSPPERRVTPTVDPPAGQWPREWYDAHSRRHNPQATPPRSAPEERWRVGIDHVPALAVADGTVFAGDSVVRALATGDGHERWRVDTGATGLTYVAGRLYVADHGSLTALDAATGDETWHASVEDASTKAVYERDGTVYALTDRALYGLHADTGRELWSMAASYRSRLGFRDGRPLLATPERLDRLATPESFSTDAPATEALATYQRRWPSAPVTTDGAVFLGGRPPRPGEESGAGPLTRFSASGDRVWRRQLGRHVNSPVVVDGRAYTTDYPPSARTDGGRVLALDATTGDTLWQRDLGHFLSAVAVADGTVYAGGSNPEAQGSLVALDAATGETLWSRPTDGAITTTVVAVEDTLYVGDDGVLRALGPP